MIKIEEYHKIKKELANSSGIKENEIYDISESPIAEEFLNIINFYTETLERNAHYGISPSHIFIRPYFSKNARAGLINENYLIGINLGTISWLYKNFRQNDKVNNGEIYFFKMIRKYIDIDLSELMYQSALHFTFYHELAHLVQKSDYLESYLDEEPTDTPEFNEYKHLLELDADEFSSLCVSTHILQYAEKYYKIDRPITEGFLVLILIPVILYILSFGNTNEIYYSKNTHPHPTIRLVLVTLTICHYANQSLVVSGKDFQIDHKEILFRAIGIAEEFEKECLGSNNVLTFKEVLKDNLDGILDYVDKFDQLKNDNENLAVFKWNLHAVNK